MTIEAYIKKLEKQIADMNKINSKALFEASLAVHDEMSKRIFTRGENINGQTFQYSKKEAIIGDTNSPKKFMPANISKKSKVYAFQAIKNSTKKGYFGRVFKQGYWQFRKFVGRPNDHVNFNLTGELMFDFNNGKVPNTRKLDELSFVISLRSERNIELKRHLSTKYKQVFQLSKKERRIFREAYKSNVEFLLAGGK